jgi:pyruvate,orthophosphate dikinase
MSAKLVYYFGGAHTEGSREDRALLGGKGANLAEMARIGIPVPPGFTITTDVCRHYLREQDYPKELEAQLALHLRQLEQDSGKRFGSADNPLLLSVRSGASVSMPGMMETILNLGLNDGTVQGLANASNNPRFAWDSYRRFVQMYADVVMGIPAAEFEKLLVEAQARRGLGHETHLSAEALQELTADFKALVRARTGGPFPDDPVVQLWGAIEAVFRSWNVERAIAYRRVHGIPDYLGTAVNVMAMVFGNLGEDSGTGVAFTRDPATGERVFFGEFLLNAQGEDVVAGIRTPITISRMAHALPEAYQELLQVQDILERHFRDMQDIEFTIERRKLFMLQSRTGKRTAGAAVRIAVEMATEGLISWEEAVLRVDPRSLDQLLHPRLDPAAEVVVLATGLPASPGAASGKAVFHPDDAIRLAATNEPVVLVRSETSPDDFSGMVASRAVVTARGGMTSHAAVVARGMGKCCVVGANALEIDLAEDICRTDGVVIRKGDWITIDGTNGRVLLGRVPTVEPELSDDFRQLMSRADGMRTLAIRTNADTPEDAARARSFGAEGIGLCRTEHMFFQGERIQVVREMILATDGESRRRALAALLPVQRDDFLGIFRAMDGLPVTIRLIDPPLHEFLPTAAADAESFARHAGITLADVHSLVERHREANPMLGLRGCRLGIVYPEIVEMQVRAIFEAAVLASSQGVRVLPEVMVPLVGEVKELAHQRDRIRDIAEEVMAHHGTRISYLIGTMIELPRAALMAGEIAQEAEFFSFGTNDLTQTTYGISRDDAGTFLPSYLELGIYPDDPFQVLDREGVGQLVQMATWEGRRRRRDLKVGICGEHGGEPSSIEFFHETGLDYVSCSPFRVPVARLAAAHAALQSHLAPGKLAQARAKRAESDATDKLRQVRRTAVVTAEAAAPSPPTVG